MSIGGQVCRITSLDPPEGRLTELLKREQEESENPELAQQRIEKERAQASEQRRKAQEIEEDNSWPDGADQRLGEDGWTAEQIAAIKVIWEEGRELPQPEADSTAPEGAEEIGRAHV